MTARAPRAVSAGQADRLYGRIRRELFPSATLIAAGRPTYGDLPTNTYCSSEYACAVREQRTILEMMITIGTVT